uniref:Bm1215, isoform a n=1 Tax=Brugia malayi TaxID=6279 RepID=A0A0J9XQI8_BRUMA|nr:Bm1215, isoform a [Brugia malayi]
MVDNEIFINEEGMELIYNEPSLEEDSFVRYFNETMQNVTCRASKPLIDESHSAPPLEDNDLLRYFLGVAITLPANYQMNDNSSIASEDMINSSPMDISVDKNLSQHSSSSMCCFTIPEDMSFFCHLQKFV